MVAKNGYERKSESTILKIKIFGNGFYTFAFAIITAKDKKKRCEKN